MPYLGSTPNASFSSRTKQDFTANGSTTAFTLSSAVASANDIEVFVGNVRQEPTDAYTVNGTTLTMSEAPETGLNFYVVFKGLEENSVVPADGTISSAKIASSAVTDAKIASGAVTDAKIASGITASKLTGNLPAISGSSLTGMGGKILQIVNTTDGTRRKYTSNANSSWLSTYSNLNTTITPQSSTSKLLFFVDLHYGINQTTAGSVFWRLILGSSPVAGLNGDTSQTHPCFYQHRWNYHTADAAEYGTQCASISGAMINSPGTSASTYKFEYRIQDAGRKFSINRDCSDASDSNQGNHSPTLASRCTIIEVEL